jgi:hypothetical protein
VASRGKHSRGGDSRGSKPGRPSKAGWRSGASARLPASWHRLAGYGFALVVLATVVALLIAQTASAIHLPLLGNYGVAPSSSAGSGQ